MNSTESDVKKESIFKRANDLDTELNIGYGENYWNNKVPVKKYVVSK